MLRNVSPFRTIHLADRRDSRRGSAIRNYYSADDKLFHWWRLSIPANLADDRKASCLFSSQIK